MPTVPAPDAMESQLRRKNSWLSLMYSGPLLLAIVACSANPINPDSDFWGHASMGRWIVRHRAFPHGSVNTWTVPYNLVAHSWLSQVVFYWCMLLGGRREGPYVAQAVAILTIVLTFIPLWLSWMRRTRVSASWPYLFLVAIMGSSQRFVARPEVFSTLCLTIFLLLLIRWHETPVENAARRRQLIAVAALDFLFWVNFHGSFAVGICLLGVTLFCDCLQDRFDARARGFFLLAGACVAASLINPYGWHLWQSLVPIEGSFFQKIPEWKPPFGPDPELDIVTHAQFVLVPLAFLAWIANPRRRWAYLGWLLCLVALFLRARRMAWQLDIVCLAVMGTYPSIFDLGTLWQRVWTFLLRGREMVPQVPPWSRWAVRCAMLAYVFVCTLNYAPPGFRLEFNGELYPDNMYDYVVGHPKSHIYNFFEDSNYLQWRLNEQTPMFVDIFYTGHNGYDPFLDVYGSISAGASSALSNLDAWGVQRVIANRGHFDIYKDEPAAGGRLAGLLAHDPRWRRVYKGWDGEVFDRVGAREIAKWGDRAPLYFLL